MSGLGTFTGEMAVATSFDRKSHPPPEGAEFVPSTLERQQMVFNYSNSSNDPFIFSLTNEKTNERYSKMSTISVPDRRIDTSICFR
jgi:hypothetical protein